MTLSCKERGQQTLGSLEIDMSLLDRVLDGEKGNGKKRPSISQLIADNSNNPQSMAASSSDGLDRS